MKYALISVLFVALVLVSESSALANGSMPKNLYEAVFGSQAAPQVTKVVVARIDPWIDRIVGPSPRSFESGQSRGDRQAIILDRSGEIEDQLRGTRILSRSEGCYGEPDFTAQVFPVSWAIFLYTGETGETKAASIYLAADGIGNCVSTGTHLYNIDPQALAAYLKRTFSFMNY